MSSHGNNENVDSSSNANNASGSQESNSNTPLWNYVTKSDVSIEGGGNVGFVCNYCNASFKGSYSRVKAHLLKLSRQGIRSCLKVTTQNLAEMHKVVEDAQLKLQPKAVPLPPSSQSLASSFAPHTTSLQGHNFSSKKKVH